jgi:hypothetical protein
MAEKTIAEQLIEESQLLQLTLIRQARIRAESVFAQTGGALKLKLLILMI